MKKGAIAIATIVLVGLALSYIHAQLGRILKGAAIAFVVKQFGKQINDGINALLLNQKWEHRKATKVVPIVSIGKGAYIGAAQVIGDEDKVREVEAAAQIEVDLPGKARANILIPVDRVGFNVAEMRRVYDVSVSAVIDIKL